MCDPLGSPGCCLSCPPSKLHQRAIFIPMPPTAIRGSRAAILVHTQSFSPDFLVLPGIFSALSGL